MALLTAWGVQGVLHWVGQPRPGQDPAQFEARLYDRLFSTQTPGSKRKKPNEQEEAQPAAEEGQHCSLLDHALFRTPRSMSGWVLFQFEQRCWTQVRRRRKRKLSGTPG